jgi:AraC-like DNA-binding protein
MRKKIPGETQAVLPSKQETARLTAFSPFIRQAGDGIRNSWVIEGRKLFDYLLVYTGSGRGHFTVGDRTFSVKKGDFTWVPPDTYVRMEGEASDMRVVYIHFDLIFDPERSMWDAIIPGGTLDLTPWSKVIHPNVDDPAIRNLTGKIEEGSSRKASDLLIQICFEYNRAAEPDHLYLSGLTLQLVSELINLNRSAAVSFPKHWKTLADAETYIHNHLDRELNTTELAAQFRLSAPHFRKIFREKYGISPGKMHRKLRIKKGCEFLVYSDYNVSETAFALGFSTVHSFSKAFREITGVSPTEYKRG